MSLMDHVEERMMRKDLPAIRPGDKVRVHVRVKEGEKDRIQVFEGVVISMRRGRSNATFTVRKISFGYGVERIFPLHSPLITKIEVVRSGKVRRAKLYYLRGRRGKAARLKEGKRIERVLTPEDSEQPDAKTQENEQS